MQSVWDIIHVLKQMAEAIRCVITHLIMSIHCMLPVMESNGGGGALSIQNGTSGCNPNYENLTFNNCSFTANNGNNAANIPNGSDLNNFNPKSVTFKDCWFKDADTPFSFKSIDNVTIDNLYLGGKLVEYDSQVDLTVADSVKNFTFLANGENIKKNAAPVFENLDRRAI